MSCKGGGVPTAAPVRSIPAQSRPRINPAGAFRHRPVPGQGVPPYVLSSPPFGLLVGRWRLFLSPSRSPLVVVPGTRVSVKNPFVRAIKRAWSLQL